MNKVHSPNEFVPALFPVPARQSNQSRSIRWRLSFAVKIILKATMNAVKGRLKP
jgi:hypothetical protein